MRANEIIQEGLSHKIICVDVQPEYSGINEGNENPVFPEIIDFVVNKQTGPVLMFVNAEDQGFTGDTIVGIKQYWQDTVSEETLDDWDEDNQRVIDKPIDWSRFTIVDKGYGYFRGFMDNGVPESAIIKLIRHLYTNRLNDSRQLEPSVLEEIFDSYYDDWMLDEGLSINWTSVAQLKRFNGAYIVGGGRNECLREVELLMNAFNIRYKRIDSLVYG